MVSRLSRRAWCALAILLACFPAVAPSIVGAQGVTIAITPGDTTVAPGDTFEVRLVVPIAGHEFNAYDAIVGYDPAALTFLPRAPLSLQEGSSMKNACGLTFHIFSAQADSLSISHSLLCGTPPVFLTGPAELYKLRFQASSEAQVTQLQFRHVQFFRAGVFVALDAATDATIQIGETTDTSPHAGGERLWLRAAPNPFNPNTTITLSAPSAGQQCVKVWDVRGRLVRVLSEGHFAAGDRRVAWDGRSETGVALASGVYIVSLEVVSLEVVSPEIGSPEQAGQRTATRVVLAR